MAATCATHSAVFGLRRCVPAHRSAQGTDGRSLANPQTGRPRHPPPQQHLKRPFKVYYPTLMDNMPPAPDPAYLRGQAAYHQIIHTLDQLLPPPPVDTPDARHERNQAVIARIAALGPVNAAEVDVAAQYAAASAQAMDALRLARQPSIDEKTFHKCEAQAALMMRISHSAMRTLLRMQADRRKAGADRDSWAEHIAGQELAAALAAGPAPLAAVPAPEPPAIPPPASPYAAPAMPPPANRSTAEADPASEADQAREAETYGVLYPRRAAAIRQAGGMPKGASFMPPEDGLIRALVDGTSPVLRELDRMMA
jgi:hypothetical protein